MNYESFINTEAGLITNNFLKLPTRQFVPRGLYQISCESDNLGFVGFNADHVNGSSIGFSYEHAYMATLGEYFERYCASYEPKNLTRATYETLSKNANVLHPDKLKFYAGWQYENPAFPFQKFTVNDEVAWVLGTDLGNNEKIWVPAFLVYFQHNASHYDHGKVFMQSTSTGMASGATREHSIQGAFLEVAERHAFTNFWYNQSEFASTVPVYHPQDILKAFPNNKKLSILLKNTRIKIHVVDLEDFGPVQTMLSIFFYPYKDKVMMCVGAASRFDKEEAILKSLLEGYQSVEYAIMLFQKLKGWISDFKDFNEVDDFGKHFIFYSAFPEHREKVPIVQRVMSDSMIHEPREIKKEKEGKMVDMNDLSASGAENVIYVDLSLPDIRDIGFHVSRVVVPGWSYMTGSHTIPFLGADIYKNKNKDELFTKYPHFFP